MADEAERVLVSKTLEFPAPADVMWETIADFGGLLRWWPSGIEAVDSEGAGRGMMRRLHLAGGRSVSERLAVLEPENRVMELELLDGRPAYMRWYFARYEVVPRASGSALLWSPRCDVEPGTADKARGFIEAGWGSVGKGLAAYAQAHAGA